MLNKKTLLSILTVMVITAVTAFTPSSKSIKQDHLSNSKSTDLWYYFSYVGPDLPVDFNEYTDPDNYVLIQNPNDICGGIDALCAIICARRYDNKPDFTAAGADVVVDQLHDFWSYGYPAGPTLFLKELQ